jgi:hypothetical protein
MALLVLSAELAGCNSAAAVSAATLLISCYLAATWLNQKPAMFVYRMQTPHGLLFSLIGLNQLI